MHSPDAAIPRELADLVEDFHGVNALVGDPKLRHVPPCTCFNSPEKVEPRCPVHGRVAPSNDDTIASASCSPAEPSGRRGECRGVSSASGEAGFRAAEQSPNEPGSPSIAAPNQGMPDYGLKRDYPTLWDDSTAFDFAERLGGCTDKRLAEIDEAMRELWNARRFASEKGETWMEVTR